MLGRQTQLAENHRLADRRPLLLRAGKDEMLAVTRRLLARRSISPVDIPPEEVATWARVFGGSANDDEIAVDLIAFTAAADQRIEEFASGDFRLQAVDAIEGVRARYLRELQADGEVHNLMRLAAVAQFEIPLYDRQLADPIAGLDKAISSFGIVLRDRLGVDRRSAYRLVHAALGQLLIEAASANYNVHAERLAIARQFPALGWRMRGALRRYEPLNAQVQDLEEAVGAALQLPDWPLRVGDLHELSGLARRAINSGVIKSKDLDQSISRSDGLGRILADARSLYAVNRFLFTAQLLDLPICVGQIEALAATPGSTLHNTLYLSRASDLSAFLRGVGSGSRVLASIDSNRWSVAQANVPPELAGDTAASGRYLATCGRAEMAIEPARQQVRAASPEQWPSHDLGHLSHVLRAAKLSVGENARLLEALKASGWLSQTFETGLIGPLCGALMSMANYLDTSLRHYIVTPELAGRVHRALTSPPRRRRDAPRAICLLGGFHSLGGNLTEPLAMDWSKGPTADDLLDQLAHSDRVPGIGMYELQFWSGLRALSELGAAPQSVSPQRGESFLVRLAASPPPTPSAAEHQLELVSWLQDQKAANWALCRPV